LSRESRYWINPINMFYISFQDSIVFKVW